MVFLKKEKNFMEVEEWVKLLEKKDNIVIQWIAQGMAKKPAASLVCIVLSCVVLLPLVVHYVLMILFLLLRNTGLLIVNDDEQSLSWLVSRGQLASVGLMLVITGTIILIWYIGMTRIYSKYFRTHLSQYHCKTVSRLLSREKKSD